VRVHLATLERDEVVQQRGARRGSSKPVYVYGLTPEAEYLFPKAYDQVLHKVAAYRASQCTGSSTVRVWRDSAMLLHRARYLISAPTQTHKKAIVHLPYSTLYF
jgi:predicted ArsR family transcriptional regulator